MPFSHKVISKQATIPIGKTGHVTHRKSTGIKVFSAVHTVRFKNAPKRSTPIKFGYANPKTHNSDG